MRKITNWVSRGEEKIKTKIKFICLAASSILLICFAAQLWLHLKHTSPTFDEPLHTLAGYRYWRCGNYALNPEHPPLLKLLATIPLRAQSFQEPAALPCDEKINYKLEGFIVGAQFMSQNDLDQISTSTRLAASLMSLILAVLVFLAATEMFGLFEALIALALLAFEPVLIAHGSLVTTDMAITATAFASVYALYRYLKRPGAVRLLATGLAIGCMMASKHTALLILPLLFVLIVIDVLRFSRNKETPPATDLGHQALKHLGACCVMGIMALGILWATYGFQYRALPESNPERVTLADIFKMGFDHDAINSLAGQMVQIVHQSHLIPEAYTLGLADIIGSGSRPAFLLGTQYPTGQWFYFPVAFLIKTSGGLLIFLLIALLYLPLYKKYPREAIFLLVPAAGYLLISLTFNLNIGVRHILPIYPFLIVIVAAGAGALVRRYHQLIFILIILLALHFAETVCAAPDYIAFANVFWGGTNNAYHLLGDSNVEWSQNFKLIGQYSEKNKMQNCYLSALGLGDIINRYQSCRLIPGGFVLNSPGNLTESLPETIEGTVFISTAAITPTINSEFEPFFKTRPVAILGGSILVFEGRYEVPELAARNRIERSSQLMDLKRFEEAVADSQKAVELMPQDPRPHLSLGLAFSGARQNNAARQEFQEAIRLADVDSAESETVKQSARQALDRLP